jgi:hypothetical protein
MVFFEREKQVFESAPEKKKFMRMRHHHLLRRKACAKEIRQRSTTGLAQPKS